MREPGAIFGWSVMEHGVTTFIPRRASLLAMSLLLLVVGSVRAQSQEATSFAELQVKPTVLSMQSALQFALENNPALAAQRRQRGIAVARLVIADTYPFNPTLEMRVQYASGPELAGVTNNVPVESLLLFEVEVRGQKHIRKEGAAAAMSRTEWEIAAQEQALAAQVIRAYANLLYRHEKLRLLEETLKFNEGLVTDVRRLFDLGKLRSADLIIAQTEVADNLDLVSAGRESLTGARQELNRALGIVELSFETEGSLEPADWKWNAADMAELAISRRGDLRAKRMAVAEAAANMRLAEANRYGNPVVGPVYGFDPSKIRTIGAQVNVPLPSFNVRRGEIFESEAVYVQAAVQLRQTEINVRQDVTSALARLAAAESRAEQIKRKVLPDLEKAGADIRKLFETGEPGIDMLKVVDIRRKILRARDNYLDALWSVRQARADVLAATGEPALEFGKLPEPAPSPVAPPARIGPPKQ
jgi:cobalt-zinc-cadmium efflux system outer membrane protein